jgi:hypothetical protein
VSGAAVSAELPSGPLDTVPEIADAAVTRASAAAPGLAVIAATLAVPVVLCALAAPLLAPGWPRAVLVGGPALLGLVVGLAVSTVLLGEAGLGRDASAVRAWRLAAPRLPAVALLVLFGLPRFLLGIPASAQVVLPVLLLEEVGPRAAWRRARFLVRAHRSRIHAVQLTLLAGGCCLAALPALVVLVVLPHPASGSAALAAARLAGAGLVATVIVLPLLAAGQFTVFIARREALEALDLQLVLEALDVATPVPQAGPEVAA